MTSTRERARAAHKAAARPTKAQAHKATLPRPAAPAREHHTIPAQARQANPAPAHQAALADEAAPAHETAAPAGLRGLALALILTAAFMVVLDSIA